MIEIQCNLLMCVLSWWYQSLCVPPIPSVPSSWGYLKNDFVRLLLSVLYLGSQFHACVCAAILIGLFWWRNCLEHPCISLNFRIASLSFCGVLLSPLYVSMGPLCQVFFLALSVLPPDYTLAMLFSAWFLLFVLFWGGGGRLCDISILISPD